MAMKLVFNPFTGKFDWINISSASGNANVAFVDGNKNNMIDGDVISLTVPSSADPRHIQVVVQEYLASRSITESDRISTAWSNSWAHENAAIGATYTAAKFVCDTAGTSSSGATGHFTNSAGSHSITCGAGNDCEKIVRFCSAIINGTTYSIAFISGTGASSNAVTLSVGTLATGTYDVTGVYSTVMSTGVFMLNGATGMGNDSNVKLLLNLDNATTDTAAGSTTAHNATTASTSWDTTHKGVATTASLGFGTNSRMYVADHADFAWGTGAFTMSWRVRWDSDSTCYFYHQAQDGNNEISLIYNSTNHTISFYSYVGGGYNLRFSISFTPTAGDWYTICLQRDASNNWTLGINGVAQTKTLVAGSYSNSFGDITGNIYIGGYSTSNFNGELQEIRWSNVARYTFSYTPETYQFGVGGYATTTGSIIMTDPLDIRLATAVTASSEITTAPTNTTNYTAIEITSHTLAAQGLRSNIWQVWSSSAWRQIVKLDGTTWKYNSSATTTPTWTSATVNDEHYALSQAMGTAQNQMTPATFTALTAANWAATGGVSDTDDLLQYAKILATTSATVSPTASAINVTVTAPAAWVDATKGGATGQYDVIYNSSTEVLVERHDTDNTIGKRDVRASAIIVTEAA